MTGGAHGGTGGLIRHTLFNLMGTVLPLLFAVVSVPLLIRLAGAERFGFLALMWAVAGYAGLLDLGLSRTMARRVAQGTAERPALAPAAVWRNVRRVLLVGLAVAAVLATGWHFWGHLVVRHEGVSWDEINGAVRYVVLMVPCIATTSALRGVLEGSLRFGKVNLLRGGFTVLAYCALIGMAFIHPVLPLLTAGVLAVRICDLCAHMLAVRHEISGWQARNAAVEEKGLWRESAWFMSSQVIVPFTMYMDRFFVSSVIGLGAVTHYSVPYELATKLLLLPIALSSALFPRFASQGAVSYEQAARTVAWLMCLPCMMLIWLGGDILHLWVQFDVVSESTWALIALVVGIWFNSVAQIPYAWLQARGFVRATVGLHLCELPFYLALTYFGAVHYGIIAVGVAWAVRAGVDCVALLWTVRRKGGPSPLAMLPGLGGGCGVVFAAALLAALMMSMPVWVRWSVSILAGAGLSSFLWFRIIPSDSREALLRKAGFFVRKRG